MTTLYVREGAEFREAEPADIFTRAHALISQRYRSGSPVLSDHRARETDSSRPKTFSAGRLLKRRSTRGRLCSR